MTIDRAAWLIRRLLVGHGPADEDLQALPPSLRGVARHLAALDVASRLTAWGGYLAGRDDAAQLVAAVVAADPEGPAPEPGTSTRCAHLGHMRRLVANSRWPWPGWLAAAVLNGLAADPGTGKTLMAFALARLLWSGSPWVDGQPNPLPAGTKTLWVPADRHYAQLLELADRYGLPDEALLLNAPEDDPSGGLDLDDPDNQHGLEGRIRSEEPGLVVVDTVGMTTARNLCRPEDAAAYFGRLMEIAGRTGVAFLLLTHLSKDGEALGRRINGACRLVWKMTAPDPEGQPDRRRIWVDKSYAAKPPALGMTIAEAGCTFDFSPPSAPESGRGGRPPAAREKARRFLYEALGRNNAQRASSLCREWEESGGAASAFWRARDAMVDDGELVCEGRPLILHLYRPDGDAANGDLPPGLE